MTTTPSARARMTYRAIALALVALFLASVARFYHRDTGFTSLIGFPQGHAYELPALRAIPHEDYPPWASYDGQFYAQLALDPLLRDPAIDQALDQPPYRARRILFSWTAWLLGLGRPWLILQAFALQNVIVWLALAFLMTRWLPLTSPRTVLLWSACLFAHGLLWSVRFSLLDGPSLLLIVLAIAAAESGRQLAAAAILGVSALGRETNLLGAVGLKIPASRRDWLRLAFAGVLIVLPLLIWQDYLWSIYRSTALAGQDQLDRPFVAYAHTWREALRQVSQAGLTSLAGLALAVVISMTAQVLYLLRRPSPASQWWRVAAAYGVLVVLVHYVVWEGYPGAITRVVLPLTFGFNVLLAREPGLEFWPWFVLGNLHLVASRLTLWS